MSSLIPLGPIARTVLAAGLLGAPCAAQSVEAARILGTPPRLDGRLSEALWSTSQPLTGFLQRDPDEGAPATERTEVRFAYDDDALYVGARMFSTSPNAIRALVTRHDREGSSEQLIVSFDTHHDRRTAYTFAVTPASVRIDYYRAISGTRSVRAGTASSR